VVHRDKPPWLCSNCKKEGHLATYCIKTGGSMAGKTLDEARTAQWNTRRNGHTSDANPQQTSTATMNMVTASRTPQETTVMINSQTFILMPAAPTIPAIANTAIAHSDTVFPGNLSDYDTDAPFPLFPDVPHHTLFLPIHATYTSTIYTLTDTPTIVLYISVFLVRRSVGA